MRAMAATVTARKKTYRNAGEAPARKPKAAPGFLTWVILKNPPMIANDSWMRSACSSRLAVDPAAVALLPLRTAYAYRKTGDLGAPIGLADLRLIDDPD